MTTSLHNRISPAADSAYGPGLTAALAVVEDLAADMALRWRQGQRPGAEEYLARHPELLDVPEAALELIAEEIALRQEHGQAADASSLARRFPQWAEQVRELVDCQQFLAMALPVPSYPAAGECLGEFELLA